MRPLRFLIFGATVALSFCLSLFNAGDPSRGTVDEETNQNAAFPDPVATLSNASSYTVTESPGDSDYDGL